MSMLDLPVFCAASVQARQISFTVYSSEVAVYISASARVEFKLLLFQNWTKNFYIYFALHPSVSDGSC